MEKKTKYLIITLCCILGLVLGTTTAWYTWTSGENTDVTFTIGGITITYEAGDNIDKNLRPTSSKTNEEYAIQKDIDVSSSKTAYINLRLTVNEIATELNDRSFKWEVYEVEEDLTEVLLNDGNFKYVEVGDKITILPDMEINNTEKKIRLYIWIDGNMENPSSMGGQPYKFVLSADASDKLPESLQTLTNLGLNEYLNEGTPDFSTIETETLEKEIYAAEDDLGTSYYFRGASENNYVKFEGKTSTITYEDAYRGVQMVGEEYFDSLKACEFSAAECQCLVGEEPNCDTYVGKLFVDDIRYLTYEECNNAMMQLGTMPTECVFIEGKTITTTVPDMWFRIIRINGDGTIRLIYDGNTVHRNGTTSDSSYFVSNYDDDNWTVDRYQDNVLRDWYNENIKNSTYEEYVSVSIFCSDSEVISKDDSDPACGYLHYASTARINNDNPKPSLKCGRDGDKYQLSVGTITIDEAAFAGGRYGIENNKFYLYNGYSFRSISYADSYTCTPPDYYGIASDGSFVRVYYNYRPVINLKSDTLFTGTGTWDDPFVIDLD